MDRRKDLEAILKKITLIYQQVYQKDLVAVLLYGSYARGDYTEFSDIDITGIAEGERLDLQKRLEPVIDLAGDLGLEYEILICPTIIPRSEFESYQDIMPYYKNIKKEGVKLIA